MCFAGFRRAEIDSQHGHIEIVRWPLKAADDAEVTDEDYAITFCTHGHADISRLSDCCELALACITATGMATGLCRLRLARVTLSPCNRATSAEEANLSAENISAALTRTSNMDIAHLFLQPGHRQNRCCFRKHATEISQIQTWSKHLGRGNLKSHCQARVWHLITAMLKFLRLKAALTMSRLPVFCN